MNEKKFTYLLISAAALAVLIVILVNIPWGGDKRAISNEYNLGTKDHVFETISFNEVMEKIERNENFQLFIGSSELNTDSKINTFVFETNKLAKSEVFKIDVIYYLNLEKLTNTELNEIKIETNENDFFPTLVYFKTDLERNRSQSIHISAFKNLKEHYESNWSILLTEYFKECYN